MAIIDALDKFYHYVHGQKFIIHTDHAALTWLKNVKNVRCRFFRWSLKLSMFDYEINYQKVFPPFGKFITLRERTKHQNYN